MLVESNKDEKNKETIKTPPVVPEKKTLKHKLWENRELLLYLGFAAFLVVILIPLITLLYFFGDLSSKERLMNRNNTGIELQDRDGNPFFSFDRARVIKYIPLSDIPKDMQNAAIASEDRNFYTNPGISFTGIGRALVTDIKTGQLTEGGSTITQELVKNALLTSGKNFLRKYQEVVLAYVLNKKYSKNDILEMYLNSVYFGEGAFGVENAAQAYFGKDAKDLTLSESSLLAALLPAPSALSPLSNDPQLARKRQANVLDAMEQQGYITAEQVDEAKNTKLVFNPKKEDTLNTLAPHFALYVKSLLDKQYGEDNALRSGFTVKTSLNSQWQAYAERVVKNQVSYLRYNKASNGAAVVIDPKTGEIEVMVGSYDWNDTSFGKANMATASRQPGSSFKPIIYSDAIGKRLITAATILHDDATTFPGNYKPLDFDKRFRGPVTVRRALANSLNIPAVEVMQKVGVTEGLSWAKNLGISSLKDSSNYGLSLVLGAAEIPLLEMTDAYATFANAGKYNPPTAILEIKDKYNNTVYSYNPQPNNVVDDGVAFIISSILSDNSTRAEEFGNALTISRQAAVKTGTTENFRDALTLGYTPSLAVGVWVGNNDNTPMDNIAGSLGAAPIWRQLMEHFLAGTAFEKFQKPSDVVQISSCPYLGTKSNQATSSAYMEYYLAGTEPQNPCASPTSSITPNLSGTPTPSTTGNPTPSQGPTDTPVPTPTTEAAPTVPAPSLFITPQVTGLP